MKAAVCGASLDAVASPNCCKSPGAIKATA
jgi:hypothetical protein